MQKWLEYEHQVCEYHARVHGHTVYHWSNVPEDVLIKSGFVQSARDWRLLRKCAENGKQMREFGLDGIAVSSDGVYHGIQAKCRNNKLCACDIGSFIAVSKGRFEKNNPLSRGYLYHTTTIQHDLWNDLQCMDNIIVQHLPYCNDSNQLLESDSHDSLDSPDSFGSHDCGIVQLNQLNHSIKSINEVEI